MQIINEYLHINYRFICKKYIVAIVMGGGHTRDCLICIKVFWEDLVENASLCCCGLYRTLWAF